MEGSKIAEWSEIRNIFGNTVAELLKEYRCVVRKSKTGAFVMNEKDWHIFSDCDRFMKKPKLQKKTDPQNQQVCNTNPSSDIFYVDTNISDNLYLFENFRRNPDFEAISDSLVVEFSQVGISPNSSPSKERNDDFNVDDIDGSICLKRTKINEMRSGVFRNLYGIVKNHHTECSPKFRAVVQCFIRNHVAFKYHIIIDSFPQDETLIDGALSKKQTIEFFHKVLHSVVPVSLFGNKNNFKKIKKAVNFFLKSAIRESFSINYVFKKLNKNSVVWLRKIKTQRDQELILYHVVRWFFEEFIASVIGTYLYTEKGPDNQRYFFRRWKKKFDNRMYIKEQVQKKILVQVQLADIEKNVIPIAKLVFYTKTDGIRPILSTMATPEQKSERQVIKSLLRQLYLKNYEITNLKKIHQVWKDFKTSVANSENTPVYFVSCDILDAYGSIIQDKLFKMITDELEKLPKKLVARWFGVLNPSNSPVIKEYVDSLAPELLPLTLPPRCLCCLDKSVNELHKVVNVELIKQKLEAYIFKQPIYVHQKYYILKQGVGQGLPMSALLCDLYYADMQEKELSSFKEYGHFFRYVDDFLYLTKSEDAAKRFLEKVNEGIDSYNCTFKQRKTQTNLMPYNSEEFIYLGYRFNIKTFHVIPEYSSSPIRYTTAISRPRKNALSVFIRRVANARNLKLCPLIMDLSINSQEVVLNNIEKASTLNAQRCLALVMNMFDLQDINYSEIFHIIKGRSALVLIAEFLGLMSINAEIGGDLKKQVKELVWSSYYKVFQSKKFVKSSFLQKIKQQYINKNLPVDS